LIATNLCYLLRRNWLRDILPGQLVHWMTAHIATGILALLLVLVHAAFAPKNTLGGQALATLALLVVTGAIGRYFYAFLPRAANGKELELSELHAIIASDLARWDAAGGEYSQRVCRAMQELVASHRWDLSLFNRIQNLARTRAEVRARIRQLREDGLASGLSRSQVDQIAALAQRTARAALGASHFEDLRALLGSWRYFHRWIALAMVLLIIAHVVAALRYSNAGP
jgi:predicted ferric reductase